MISRIARCSASTELPFRRGRELLRACRYGSTLSSFEQHEPFQTLDQNIVVTFGSPEPFV